MNKLIGVTCIDHLMNPRHCLCSLLPTLSLRVTLFSPMGSSDYELAFEREETEALKSYIVCL